MNTKRITLHDCHCNGTTALRDPPPVPQLPASPAGLPSSPLHQESFMSSAPYHHHKQYNGAGCPREKHYAPSPAFAQSCVGCSTAAEDLVGIAQFNLPHFGMIPPATATAADRRLLRSSPSSELLRQLDAVMLRLRADQSSSCVRTYHVRPQWRDATDAEHTLPAPPEHQEQAHDHGLCAKAAASTTVPASEAAGSSLESLMESYLSAMSCVGAPATASHARTSNSNAAPPAARPSKTRIRWTQDLHERFVECVNQLGGADKATPKTILKLMKSDGLTIYHIKSHLQKHRTARCTLPPSSSSEGNQHEEWGDKQNPEPKTGMHITEALRVQLGVQRLLHHQLEMQRRLQVRIEEQGKMLQKMFERQLKAGSNSNPRVPSPGPDGDDDVLLPAATAEQDDAVFVDIFMDDGDDEMKLLSSYDD